MNKPQHILALLLASLLLAACEKEIDIVLPEATERLVVEGRIETDQPAFVVLTRSTGYFEPADIESFENSFVHDALVIVSNGTATDTLEELCANELPPELLPFLAGGTGISIEDLEAINYCLYAPKIDQLLSGNFIAGEAGRTYTLYIEADGEQYNSKCTLPPVQPLDSVWFQREGHPELGFVWATLNDPDTTGNAYRWWAQRINKAPSGNMKDATFVAPLGGSFDDRFVNGRHFYFGYNRGRSTAEDPPEESGFKLGDTIVVKFSANDIAVFRFLRSYENEASNAGNPFASPSPIASNIDNGALGVWAGYSNCIDTVYANQ